MATSGLTPVGATGVNHPSTTIDSSATLLDVVRTLVNALSCVMRASHTAEEPFAAGAGIVVT